MVPVPSPQTKLILSVNRFTYVVTLKPDPYNSIEMLVEEIKGIVVA